MSKKIDELQKELIIAMDQLQILIEGKRYTKTSSELKSARSNALSPYDNRTDPLVRLEECSEALSRMRKNLVSKPPSLDQKDLNYLCSELKLTKHYFLRKPLFNSLILMARAFFRIVDAALTLGFTWNEAGWTPGAKSLMGRSQFFALSERGAINSAIDKFNTAKTKFDIELQKIDKADLENSDELVIATAVPTAPQGPTAPPK